MQIVAGSWLIYTLTNSALLLGAFAFALNFPTLIVSPFAGVAADRFERRSLLVLVNTLSMVQAFILWVLVLTHMVQVWHIMVLTTMLGILNAFELPIRQSFISKMIADPNDLPNAVALNSSVFNGSRLVGPAVAGLIISLFGEGICFLLNALSFLPVIAALCLMRMPEAGTHIKRSHKAGYRGSLMEGLRYAAHSLPLRWLLIMVSVLSTLSGAFHSLAPVFAREVFHGGPELLGFMLAASGLGAFFGAIYLAGRRTVIGLGRVAAVAGAGAAAALMAFSVIPDFRIAVAAVFFSGLGMIMSIGGMNVMIQTVVDEEKRGRVMSLYAIALVGISPLGSLVAGAIASHAEVSTALMSVSLFALFSAVVFWFRLPKFRSRIRPIYAAKGIIPEA